MTSIYAKTNNKIINIHFDMTINVDMIMLTTLLKANNIASHYARFVQSYKIKQIV